jgi:hypothetical protein
MPLGGSSTSLRLDCRMMSGKGAAAAPPTPLAAAVETVSHSRKLAWGLRLGSACTSLHRLGIQSPARWLFSRITQRSSAAGHDGAIHTCNAM